MEGAFRVLATDEPDEDLATLAAELGRLHAMAGRLDAGSDRVELALRLAEMLWLPEVLCEALVTKAVILDNSGRVHEGLALVAYALELALEQDLASTALRAYNNLAETLARQSRYEDVLERAGQGVALARKVGDRVWEGILLDTTTYPLMMLGRWDEAVQRGTELGQLQGVSGPFGLILAAPLCEIHVHRGQVEEARRLLSRFARSASAADIEERTAFEAATAIVLRAEGRPAEALVAAEAAFEARDQLGPSSQAVKFGFVEAAEAALALGDLAKAEELLAIAEGLRPGQLSPYLHAQALRLRARLAAAQGDAGQVAGGYKGAAGLFQELGAPFWLAVTQLEHAKWLAAQGRRAEAGPLLDAAEPVFERLRAAPWGARLRTARRSLLAGVPAAGPG
jgi:tetratricopeptide (TPR) repeat protein